MKKPNYKIDEVVWVFIVVVIVMLISVYEQNKPKTMEAEKITGLLLDDHALSIAYNGIVDKNKLQEIQSMDYEEFKKMLRIEGDVCIYIEDENGNIILINDSYRAIGSPDINITGIPCSQK